MRHILYILTLLIGIPLIIIMRILVAILVLLIGPGFMLAGYRERRKHQKDGK